MVNVTPIAYVNGAYVPLHDARIPLLDRAALFADAVYEVMWVEQGRLIDFDNHWRRGDCHEAALHEGCVAQKRSRCVACTHPCHQGCGTPLYRKAEFFFNGEHPSAMSMGDCRCMTRESGSGGIVCRCRL